MLGRLLKLLIIVFILIASAAPSASAVNSLDLTESSVHEVLQLRRQRESRAASLARSREKLLREIRRELVTLPFYGVFDWLEGEARTDGTVVLRGQVVRPTTRRDAEARVKDIEGVALVRNEIEILPASPNDDRLRVALYRAIYSFDSPLFRYAARAVPPIHIIVKNGRVTLRGVVATPQESRLAYMTARGVPSSFEVTNELRAESEMSR